MQELAPVCVVVITVVEEITKYYLLNKKMTLFVASFRKNA